MTWKYPHTFKNSNGNPPEVDFVMDVLEMWSNIEASFAALDAVEQKRLVEVAGPRGKSAKFRGFDGNNESEYLALTKIFLNDLNLFTELSGRGLNSHAPMVDRYERMLEAHNSVMESKNNAGNYGLLTTDEIAQILIA